MTKLQERVLANSLLKVGIPNDDENMKMLANAIKILQGGSKYQIERKLKAVEEAISSLAYIKLNEQSVTFD